MTNVTKKFAVIQNGCTVFGIGNTREGAILEAAKWIEPIDGGRQGDATVEDVETLLNHGKGRNVHGCFYVINSDDDQFNDYVKNI